VPEQFKFIIPIFFFTIIHCRVLVRFFIVIHFIVNVLGRSYTSRLISTPEVKIVLIDGFISLNIVNIGRTIEEPGASNGRD